MGRVFGMKYFFDTEFIEDGSTIDLISIGIIAESAGVQTESRTLYLQNAECGFVKASEWVWRNVFPHLLHFDMRGKRGCSPIVRTVDSGLSRQTDTPCFVGRVPKDPSKDIMCPWATRREIRDEVLAFCDVEKYGKPEFWGYYADYDWVAFCQLFGTMIQLPRGFPMYCRDLKQLLDDKGNPKFQKSTDAHHSLSDAEWILETYNAVSKI